MSASLEASVLVTGFGPFLDVADNPSARIAAALDGRLCAGARVVTRVLPVTFGGIAASVREALAELRPIAVVALGAGGDHAIHLEQVARNRVTSTAPDADGAVAWGHEVVRGGPERLTSPLPVGDWARALTSSALAVQPSDDAGGYVCNAAFYALLHETPAATPALFVHVPRAVTAEELPAAAAVVWAIVQRVVACSR